MCISQEIFLYLLFYEVIYMYTKKIKLCNNKFTCIEYKFNYESDINDKEIINSIIEQGNKLAEKVNPTLARDSSKKRNNTTILNNCIAGMIAEYCWLNWFNSNFKDMKLDISAQSTTFESANNQIDIIIRYPDGDEKSIEVRSSFPYLGLEAGVCRVFDIIGWYVNKVKIKEVKKDYYARFIFPFDKNNFNKKAKKDGFCVYLTGGASKQLLQDSEHSGNKKFKPMDEICISTDQSATYRVIKPIKNGYDTDEFTKRVISRKQ